MDPSFESRNEVLLQLAAEYGTPAYVYFEDIVLDRIRRLKSHLDGLPLRLLYAMKANHAVPLLKLMLEEGLGIDAVSPAELLLALKLGFPPNQIFFSANNMTNDEMRLAMSKGVVLNIGELSRLEKLGKEFPGSSVSVRLNPQIGAGHHEHVITAGENSKFGIPVEQTGEIHRLSSLYNISVVGLHQHIGSGILDTETLWKAMSVLLQTSLSFKGLEFINLGGGLGVPYRPNESGLDIEHFKARIARPLQSFIDSHPSDNLEVWFEPGRYFTAESGVLLAAVNTLKETKYRTFAGTDSGMNHLVRPAMYDAYHHIVNLSHPQGPVRTYDLVGNICESADFFAKNRELPKLREGDIIGIMDSGAYGISMATTYNLRALPAEIWVDSNSIASVIRSRKTPEQVADEVFTLT